MILTGLKSQHSRCDQELMLSNYNKQILLNNLHNDIDTEFRNVKLK